MKCCWHIAIRGGFGGWKTNAAPSPAQNQARSGWVGCKYVKQNNLNVYMPLNLHGAPYIRVLQLEQIQHCTYSYNGLKRTEKPWCAP